MNTIYDHLSKEELIALLENKNRQEFRALTGRDGKGKEKIKPLVSEILLLLFKSEEKDSVEKSIELLLKFFDADWAHIALFEKEEKRIDFMSEVTSPWIAENNQPFWELTYDKIPWVTQTILSGRDVVVPNTSYLPIEASADKIQIDRLHLLSVFITPLSFLGEVQGFIGLDTVRAHRFWTEREREDMHIVASMFSIIVERRLAKNKLEESRKYVSGLSIKFQQFFEHLPLGVELYDANGIMIDNNEADSHIFGTTREELLGLNIFENPNVSTDIIKKIQKGEKVFSFPLHYNFDVINSTNFYDSELAGHTKHLNVKGLTLTDPEFGKIGYLFIISDMTEDHIKNEQTENHLATLKAALLSGHALIGEYDIKSDEMYFDPILNDHISRSNFFDFIKYKRRLPFSELLKFSYFEPDGPNSFDHFIDVVEGRSDNCSITGTFSLAEEIIWVRLNAQSYKKSKEGIAEKIICYCTNITAEKQLEDKLHQAESETRRSELERQKAQEADKLKSTFLANMSHEIRTPLNAIIGFSTLIAEAEVVEDKHNYLDIINENSELLLRLITDILDFSKIESGRLDYSLADVSIKKLCTDQYAVHALKDTDQVRLIHNVNDLPDFTLHTDPRRVTQVISNMLTNARKFTDHGSISLSYHQEGDFLKVVVADTGIGIPEAYKDTVFDRFVKVDSFRQGTGLGLPICKTIMEALGGHIGMESVEGEGSTFWFTLPL